VLHENPLAAATVTRLFGSLASNSLCQSFLPARPARLISPLRIFADLHSERFVHGRFEPAGLQGRVSSAVPNAASTDWVVGAEPALRVASGPWAWVSP